MQPLNIDKKPLKVAIIGKLPSKYQAPFADTTFQIWGCNVHHDMANIPRFDLWFDLHSNPSVYNIPNNKLILHKNYPLNEVIDLVGGSYFNNSISYMIAYAILKGAEEISLYGVRLDNGEEIRTKQLQNVRELLFFAKGRGIKVYSYETNVLENYKLYGGF